MRFSRMLAMQVFNFRRILCIFAGFVLFAIFLLVICHKKYFDYYN